MVDFDLGSLIGSMRINTPLDTEYVAPTLDDIDTLIESVHRDHSQGEPLIYVSPLMYHRILHFTAIGKLYRHVLPRPQKRRLRKVAQRRIQRRLTQGMRHIDHRQRVIERNERAAMEVQR